MALFSIGDQVVAVAPVGGSRITGVHGEVVGFDQDGSDYIAVEFEDYIDGNDLYDLELDDDDDEYECPDGYGWWCLPGDIALAVQLDDVALPEEIDLL